MTDKKSTPRWQQQAARRRMKLTGEKYTAALKAVQDENPRPENAETAAKVDPSEA